MFYLFSKIIQLVVIKNLKKLAEKTKSDKDDKIISATAKPFVRFLSLIGIKIAITVMPFGGIFLTSIHRIINSLMIIVIGLFVMKIVNIFIGSWGKNWAKKTKSSLDDEFLPLIHKFSDVVMIIIISILILSEWNVNVTSFIAGLGIAGIAIGFAVKDSLANIFGGISIILDRAIKVGDVIKLEDGKTGTIMDIGLRSTKLRTWSNELLIIPNGQFANTTIQNYKKPDLSVRGEVNFGVEYGSDVDKVRDVVLGVLNSIEKIIKNNPKRAMNIQFLRMGDFALEFSAKFWVEDYTEKFSTELEATEKIYKALNKSKIGIPFPTRTIYLKKE